MTKKAHFNPKSLTWLISLAVMIVLCVAVVFGSKFIYDFANQKYTEHHEVSFTISSTKDVDISDMRPGQYSVKSVKEAYDSSNKLVAYIVEGTTMGYNRQSPIEMSTIISADGNMVCSIDILDQNETEYLGVRIEEPSFKSQFEGRYLPVVLSGGTTKGSPIDGLTRATISSQAVIDGVNSAQSFVVEHLIDKGAAE